MSSAAGHGLDNGEWLHWALSPVAMLAYLTFYIKQTLCALWGAGRQRYLHSSSSVTFSWEISRLHKKRCHAARNSQEEHILPEHFWLLYVSTKAELFSPAIKLPMTNKGFSTSQKTPFLITFIEWWLSQSQEIINFLMSGILSSVAHRLEIHLEY